MLIYLSGCTQNWVDRSCLPRKTYWVIAVIFIHPASSEDFFLNSPSQNVLLTMNSSCSRFMLKMFHQVTCIVGRRYSSYSCYFCTLLCFALIALINHRSMKSRSLLFHVVCSLMWQCTLGLHHTVAYGMRCLYQSILASVSKWAQYHIHPYFELDKMSWFTVEKQVSMNDADSSTLK